ncbi:UDP-glucuronosyltransferase 2C1-like [Corythoichthys intestinalis]|uniref:UDP-glucuronosyltransferase 2C1-like n=1 Tax=Corythoichthys intestinalis TaxID=161448 RepID=UPI0025A64397|nr:UDP-glucuronosyltransferase 2C1-like [Corythoichthys intestinalis]XP_061795956.1 UDP-glucuronosyltransferase 2C1-like [Nerophis lumbriciformis]
MRLMWYCGAFLLSLFLSRSCHGGNILVFPIEGSHWVNMDILMRELHSQGHNLTIVRPSKTWYMKDNASYFNTISVPVERSLDKDFITGLLYEVIEYERGSLPLVTFLHMSVGMFGMFMEAHQMVGEFATAILDDKDLTKRLKDSNFDLILSDPAWAGGVIVAKYLNLPLVYNVRWLIATEGHITIAPSPLSYIPITGTGNTNKMSFLQRVKNVIVFLVGYTQHILVIKNVYQKICDKYLGPDIDMHHLLASADLWLMRVDFVFEFPRPTMPNVVYIGGFQCKPAKPLPDHLEEFVQSSGEHGVILMSLGTFVTELPVDLAEKIAADFAKLPQKVIWRYKGAKPSTLGNNTLIVDWMPQNDLLGHPKIKLFVAHGGTNGIQEAIYHGVPVVGIPLFFDQHDNLLRLSERGAAIVVMLALVDKDDNFLKAIQEVIANPTYKNNMERLSRLHKDKPIPPLKNAIFWIEFVMRHKGAAHLKTDSYKLPWYIYYSLDVYLFLTAALLALFLALFITIRCMCSALCRRKVKRE